MRPVRILIPALVLTAAACGMSSGFPAAIRRPAEGAPDRFVRADSSPITGTPGAAACTSPIADPRTGARLMLERSTGGRGDYSAPDGAYGMRTGELLRVDCANGSPIGIVRG